MLTSLKSKVITFLSVIFMFITNATVAFAEKEGSSGGSTEGSTGGATGGATGPLDITAGLGNVDKTALANKIIAIATGVGAVAGSIAVAALIYVGFRMATATDERTRAEAKAHMIQILIGLGIIGLAVMIVGFIAFLIKG